MYSLDLTYIDLDKLFTHFDGVRKRLKCSTKGIMRSFLSLWKKILICNCQICVTNFSESAKILFLFPSINQRLDIRRMMTDTSRLLDEKEFDFIEWKGCKHLSLVRSLTMMSICWKNAPLIKRNSRNLLVCLQRLIGLMDIADREMALIKKTSLNKYKLCVVVYDAQLYENYFIQKFKSIGVKTATLQHGIMLCPRKGLEDNIDFMGLEFGGFVSDCFLVWNDFTKNEAMKYGIPSEKIKVLGNIKCLNIKAERNCSSNVFGVILDGRFEQENNEPMLRMSNEIAEKYEYKYVYRYHPNYKKDEYEDIVSKEYGEMCSFDISLSDFLSQMTFCILSNSTVLFELPYYGVPYYRYSSRGEKDKYCDLEEESFSDINEFDKLFDPSKTISPQVSQEEIRNNYKTFLKYTIEGGGRNWHSILIVVYATPSFSLLLVPQFDIFIYFPVNNIVCLWENKNVLLQC